MKHPPYHLRVNKAVDRLAFIDAIKRLEKLGGDLSDYTYYGFGGPYLEDFRLIYEFCPEIIMVSIERNKHTLNRQEFHRPCGKLNLDLTEDEFDSFLVSYTSNDKRSIFWLDYSDLTGACYAEFKALASKLAEESMLKITLPANPSDFIDKPGEIPGTGADKFRRQFGNVMRDRSVDPPRKRSDFAKLLQDMLRIAAEQAFPSTSVCFQPVSSFYYSDGTPMFTLTGIICRRERKSYVEKAYKGWDFANLNWAGPKIINLPDLSTKERLRLQEFLPCHKYTGRVLRLALGYYIDKDCRATENKLKHYAEFHRYSPYFVKAIP